MRIMPFAHQLLALRHAELVLLVDNDQSKILHLEALLNQSMRADEQALYFVLWTLDLARLVRAGLQVHHQTERFEPAPKSLKMLFGQNLRRGHERYVKPAFKSHERAAGSHHRFT